ncbi:MAG: hypothetical protein HY342_10315 [Candidatus Lambdaproteobacteria bacterium]|nr:hypothetical protein [Candidatus Lambdaproteobacteria bacterium]
MSFVAAKLASLRAKGIVHTFVALVAVQVLAFAMRILLGRWLSLEEFGRIALLIESINMGASLLTLGLPTAMMWYGVRENRPDYHLAGALRMLGIGGAVALLAYAAFRQAGTVFDDAAATRLLDTFVWLAPLHAVFNYVAAYLIADKRGGERAWLILLQRASFVALVLACALLDGFRGALAGLALSMGAFAAGVLWRYRRAAFAALHSYPYVAVLRFSFWDSVGLVPTTLAPFLLLALSERLLQDVSTISHLSMALSFTVVARFAFSAIADNMFPYFMGKADHRAFVILLGKLLLLYAVLAAAVLLVAFAVVPPLIDWLLGARFQPSIALFQIVIVGETLLAFSLLFEKIHQALRLLKLKAACINAALVTLVAALLLWLPAYGITGAAYAFLAYVAVRVGSMTVSVVYILLHPSTFRIATD